MDQDHTQQNVQFELIWIQIVITKKYHEKLPSMQRKTSFLEGQIDY